MVSQVSLLPSRSAQGQIRRSSADRRDPAANYLMKAELVRAASQVIPNQGILVNMVSRRVRQLTQGHRSLVEHAPGLRAADIALTEIIQEKLTFESTLGAGVVEFPGVLDSTKKAA